MGDTAAILITDPSLARDDARVAFDEIDERYHVSGVEVEFAEEEGEPLLVLFCATAEVAVRR